jgi:tetratricopeptide (TPR) repeat protein
MEFSQDNKIVHLCIKGMELEGQGNLTEASTLFKDAWKVATTDFEKFTAAHYVARHQNNVTDKLKWDQIALQFALKIDSDTVKETYPSLYLNIAKCYEDLKDFDNARKNYRLALSFTDLLPQDGYGNMIKGGITNGIERVK